MQHCVLRTAIERLFADDVDVVAHLRATLCAAHLQQIRMDGDMLTEDIDSSFRASLLPVKICYCYQVGPRSLLPVVSR